jgi:hypothetical protein
MKGVIKMKTSKNKAKTVDLSRLRESWDSPFVARREIERFSGGMLKPRTLANLDSLGVGVPGRFTVGKTVMYPIEELISWLEGKASV